MVLTLVFQQLFYFSSYIVVMLVSLLYGKYHSILNIIRHDIRRSILLFELPFGNDSWDLDLSYTYSNIECSAAVPDDVHHHYLQQS